MPSVCTAPLAPGILSHPAVFSQEAFSLLPSHLKPSSAASSLFEQLWTSPVVPSGGVSRAGRSPGMQEAAGGWARGDGSCLGNPNEPEIVSDVRLQQQL